MRNPIRNRFAKISGSALLLAAWAFFASALPASAHELKDVSLITAGGQTYLKLVFAPNGTEGDYPLYFQKTDLTKGTTVLSFLETETAYPLGRHPLEAGSPDLEEILLKKLTTPSGKSLLGLEMKFKQPPMGDVVLQPAPKGVLKVMLGKAKGKYSWSLSKSLTAEDAYLSAKAEAPPAKKGGAKKSAADAAGAAFAGTTVPAQVPEAAPAVETSRPEPVTPAVPTEPSIPGRSDAAADAGADMGNSQVSPGSLAEVKMIVTSAQANLLLVLNPPAAPNYAPQKNAKDSSWLEVTLDNVTSGLARKDYALPKNPIYKRIKTTVKGTQLVLHIQLARGETVQITPQETGLAVSGLVKGDPAPAFKWTTLKPDAKESESVAETVDPVKSAHEEGEALESGMAGKTGKGLSSSRIFSLSQGGKTMVLFKDSASLKTEPGPNGKLIRKIPIGEKVVRLDNQAGNLRVVSGADTGFIRAGDAVYEDELTKAQEKSIEGRIEAKQAIIAAAAAKAAAALAKQEEKARKAEELAHKKEAAAAAKAMAKAAADSAKAAKAMAKAQPPAQPQDLQESQAPSAAGAPKVAEKNPSKAEPGMDAGSQASGGAPKLAIADNPELAAKLAQEKMAAEDEKKRIEPEENRISYNSYGRRDPFIPVEQGATDNGIDIDQMKVVGIIWQSQQPMAVLEHNREAGVSFTIKEGDPVHNGRVAHITRDAVTFDISEYGISRSYSLKLVSSKEGAKK